MAFSPGFNLPIGNAPAFSPPPPPSRSSPVVFFGGGGTSPTTSISSPGVNPASQKGFFNPLDYGVVGDGVHDDTAAFQALILKARNQTNQVGISLPLNMIYKISAPLVVSGVAIVGVGNSSISAKFVPSNTFAGAALMIVDGATVGGAGRMHYANFWIDGGKQGGVVTGGLKITGSVVYNVFSNIAVTNCKNSGIQLAGSVGLRPTCNVFDVLYSGSNDGDGWEIRAGFNNTFRTCGSEQSYKINWDINSLDEIVANCAWERCWSEQSSHNFELGYNPVGQDAFYCSLLDACKFIQTNVSGGYGSNPVGTGHGFNLQNCTRCEMDACDTAYNYSGASGATSKKYNIVGGTRNIIKQSSGTVTAADINIAAVDTVVQNPWVNTIADVRAMFTSNSATALAANTTNYLSPHSGLDDVVETNTILLCPGRMHLCSLIVHCAISPGVGQTYTITVRKNQASTLSSVVVTPANFTNVSDFIHEVDFVSGDQLTLQVITSATAASLTRGMLHISLGFRR